MPSTATTRLRLEKQATGENENTWGGKLNTAALDLIDAAIAGRSAFALSGTKTLTSTNFAADEARPIFLDITSGTGGTITIPGVEKTYIVRNNSSGDVIITTGSGNTATIPATEVRWVVTDGTNVYRTATTERPGWVQLTSQGTLSGTTATFTGLPSSYAELLFVFEEVSGNSTAAIAMALSSDGSTFSSASNISPSSTSVSLFGGMVHIPNYTHGYGGYTASLGATGGTSPALSIGAGINGGWKVSGGIQAVRFSITAGAFDNGTIRVFAR